MLQIGMQLPRLVFRLAVGAENSFTIGWKNSSGTALDLTGVTVRLVIEGTVFNATNYSNYSYWTITSAQAVSTLVGKEVRLEQLIGPNTYLMARGEVVAA